MKKVFFILVLPLAFASCVSDADLAPAGGYGRISVDLTNDPIVQTRAAVADLSKWTIYAQPELGDKVYFTNGTVYVRAGEYSVTASNYPDENAWRAANNNRGDAYYVGTTENVNVQLGDTATVQIACGAAKNSRVTVTFPQTDVIDRIRIVANPSANEIVYTSDANEPAYFNPGEFHYKFLYYHGSTEVESGTYTATLEAGKETNIAIVVKEGTINVTVTTDDFTPAEPQVIVIDAADGFPVYNRE